MAVVERARIIVNRIAAAHREHLFDCPFADQDVSGFCRTKAVGYDVLDKLNDRTPMTTLNPAMARVLKRLHYPLDVILTCVRWYVAYPLSLRHLEEMMAERGISVDHSTVHRWAIKLLPVLEKAFHRRKRPVGKSWRVDETYIKVKGQWKAV
jgi:hypothetical protein